MNSKAFKEFLECMAVNKKLVIAFSLAALGLIGLQSYLHSSHMECLGMVDSKETTIAFEEPVVVKKVFVLPGQIVKKGQPLVEVEQPELNLKRLEVKTALDALVSEQSVREALLGSVVKASAAKTSPLTAEIEGLKQQLKELEKQQSQSVRFAQEDGVVATVAYRANEKVPPFMPVVTLASVTPNLVYGFVHENRISDFRVGDLVEVEAASPSGKKSTGKVVSMGNRITMFPERMQSAFGVVYWGREVVVSLSKDNAFLTGEKVRIRSGEKNPILTDLSFQAFAETETDLQPFLQGLELEAGGLSHISQAGQLLVVSDDPGPSGSPFWRIGLEESRMENLLMEGVEGLEDVESLAFHDGYYYAMGSLTSNNNFQSEQARSLLVRFSLEDGRVVIHRQLEMRSVILNAMLESALLRRLPLENMEVESLSFFGRDAYLALKEPQLEDGSSVVFKVPGLIEAMELQNPETLVPEIYTLVRLQDPACKDPSRITDLVKTETGLLLAGNCSKKEAISQVWWLGDGDSPQQVQRLISLPHARLEGLTLGPQSGEVFLSSDNGGKQGSDFFRVQLPDSL